MMSLLGCVLAMGLVGQAPPSVGGREAVQDLIFLGDGRPVFLRLRVTAGARPFREVWGESVRTLHAALDRNGDGKLTGAEAEKGALAILVRLANGAATALPRAELDVHPKDGVVSVEELSEALATSLGPFRVQSGRLATGRADALFGQLDRDRDGMLAAEELAAASALRALDLDDDEMIDAAELEPFRNPMAMSEEETPGRRAREGPVPPVIEFAPDDPSLRPVRLLVKRYDVGSEAGDNKLSRAEFAIDADAFGRADADADGSLDTEELRRFLARVAPNLELDVRLPAEAGGGVSIEVAGPGGALPVGVRVERVGPGALQIALDGLRLDVHVDDGADAAVDLKRTFQAQFAAADADKGGYLVKSEVSGDKSHTSPLAPSFDLMDRDGDGKLYPGEMETFLDGQISAARGRLVLTASDEGRALFAVLDADRDRRLGVRELRGAGVRTSSWDRNGDHRIQAEEIPHQYRLTLGRGRLAGLGTAVPVASTDGAPRAAAVGPDWFRRMDRNRDGDVSRREFLGPLDRFLRLDADQDGLLDPNEAAAAATANTHVATP